MTVNRPISTEDISDESGGPTEPVTLTEVKDYLRSENGTFDDALLTDMITEGRMWVEKFTGLHVIPKVLTHVFDNQAGNYQLPGPVRGDIVLTDYKDELIEADDYTILGTSIIATSFCTRLTAAYDAGYEAGEAPKWVKRAILAYIAFHYENRGDEIGAMQPVQAANICRPHRVINAFA